MVVESVEPGDLFKVPFMLQEQVETTETDKTRFFFVKKDELGTQQTIVT